MGGKPRALTPFEARNTLAHRLAPRVDRLRQIATKVGIRSDRVFLIWTKYTGVERGEGEEPELARVEILPTPRVSDLTAIQMNPTSGGVLEAGSVRVDRISARFNDDILQGKVGDATRARGLRIREPHDFFYEIVADGRSDAPQVACSSGPSDAEQFSGGPSQAPRARYRLVGFPERREDGVEYAVVLERIHEDRNADGTSRIGEDPDVS